jgi:putative membrane protein insertion efficiency factor
MNSQSNSPHMNLPARAAVGLVRFYQRFLSAMKPPTCRFYPTCSEYGLQAIAHRGVLRGGVLAAWRLLRCNPFSAGGYDPGPWEEDADETQERESAPEERGREAGA